MIVGVPGIYPECRLCGNATSRTTDEDVLPQWLRSFILEAVLTPEWANKLPRVKLRICSDCNGTLARNIEEPGRAVLLKMFSAVVEGPVTLEPSECSAAAAWMFKTDLLFALMRLMNSNRDVWVHPYWAEKWDAAERLQTHRERLLTLMHEGRFPLGASASAALVGRVHWWQRRQIPCRVDGHYTSTGISFWFPLLLETMVEDDHVEEHVALRSADSRFAVLHPTPVAPALFAQKAVALRDAEKFSTQVQGDRIAVVKDS